MSISTGTVQPKGCHVGLAATQGIVTIKVGAESSNMKFQVHKAILVKQSEYFRNALKGPWKEAQEQTVILRDVAPHVFTVFVHWLYYQKLPKKDDSYWNSLPEFDSTLDAHQVRLQTYIGAYAFGDRFLVPQFRRAANNLFVSATKTNYYFGVPGSSGCYGWNLISLAFENIPAERVILQYMVDEYCWKWNDDQPNFGLQAIRDLPVEFVYRVMRRLRQQNWFDRLKRYKEGEARCYMEHVSEEEKQKCNALHMRWDEDAGFAYFEFTYNHTRKDD